MAIVIWHSDIGVVSKAHHIMLAMMLVFLSCSTAPAAVAALQSVTDGAYRACNPAQFSINDTFSTNLNAVVQSLTRNSSHFLYSSASSLAGSEATFVFGIYQCRGDVSLSDCSVCVSNALLGVLDPTSYEGCGYRARGARVQYAGCFIRYENYHFFNFGLEQSPTFFRICSHSNYSSLVYQHNLGTALNSTASAAPKHALFGYNASSMGTGSSMTAYALSQCMGYLSPSQCATCLSVVSNYSAECNNSVSGQVYFFSCYYLYSNTSFLFADNSSNPSPSLHPPPKLPFSPKGSPISSPTQAFQSGKNKRNTTSVIIGIVVGVIAIATIVALSLGYLKRRKKETDHKGVQGPFIHASPSHDELLRLHEVPQQLAAAGRASRFSIKELREATDNFNPRNKLGEGGFGPVYQGTLKSGQAVAIKMLSAESRQGRTEFINEINLITTVQHRNLVHLIGYCVEVHKPLLVYEYLPNRSLDLHLFDVPKEDSLHWCSRFEIIVGIARGLAYLHHDSHLRIIHRDIKASNILLDNNLNPKIADFGLARLFGDDMTHLTTKVVGTLGYLSPEYAMGGQLSEKADVYSFGLVVLEIVSGRRVINNRLEAHQHNLLEWTWALYEKQQQLQIVDQRMQEEGPSMVVNVGEVVRVVHVALLCTQSQPHLRPSMSDVYNILNSQSNILELPTKPITVGMSTLNHSLDRLNSTEPSSSSGYSQAPWSYNEAPISEVQPR